MSSAAEQYRNLVAKLEAINPSDEITATDAPEVVAEAPILTMPNTLVSISPQGQQYRDLVSRLEAINPSK